MKVVIFAGGYGTRITEESQFRPKPMIEIGGRPILWHIMKIYSSYGFNEFVILGGYRVGDIKQYFLNYYQYQNDLIINIGEGSVEVLRTSMDERWSVTVLDTGLDTMTGGRLLRARQYLEDENDFLLTYGDGVGDVDIRRLVQCHHANGGLVTLTAVTPPGRFGVVDLEGDSVKSFKEKSPQSNHYVNAGFFVVNSSIFKHLEGDLTVFEKSPLESVAEMGRLKAYRHVGFWHPMDTLRDKIYLEKLCAERRAPWVTW